MCKNNCQRKSIIQNSFDSFLNVDKYALEELFSKVSLTSINSDITMVLVSPNMLLDEKDSIIQTFVKVSAFKNRVLKCQTLITEFKDITNQCGNQFSRH